MMEGKKLLVRVSTKSYMVPEGFPVIITHVGNCGNGEIDGKLVESVMRAKPSTVNELEVATKAVLAHAGCNSMCKIEKGNTAGIVYKDHSDNSSYEQSSAMDTDNGTASLIEENLMTGNQGESDDGRMITVGGKPQGNANYSPSWPSSLDIGSSEKSLYRNFRMDRSSDESYIPSKVVVPELVELKDTPMNLGNNKTSEKTGMGDSKHAVEKIPETQIESSYKLPSTVGYSVSATQDILEAFDEFEKENIEPKIKELVSEPDMEIDEKSMNWTDPEKQLSLEEKVEILMKRVFDDGEKLDNLVEKVEELEEKLADAWKEIDRLGGNKQSRKGKEVEKREVPTLPAVPIPESWKKRGGNFEIDSSLLKKKQEPIKEKPKVESTVFVHPKPTYMTSDEERAKKRTFASVANEGAKRDGYEVVKNRKRFEKQKPTTPETITEIPVRERHLTIKFDRERDEVKGLADGLTRERIRNVLNKLMTDLNATAYFAIANLNRWGDVQLTLANTKAEDIVGYYEAMRESLEEIGVDKFKFVRDLKKVKVYVGMVPLSRYGNGWEPKEWERKESYETLAADIESSNPGVYIAAKPIWAGRLHKLKERRVNNAGLILVVERTNEINNMLRSNTPKMVVMGRHRMCRLWREDHPAAVCRKCQQIGHSQGECRNEAVCSFCRKNHEMRNHVCPVTTCRKKGMVCEHVRKICFSCNEEGHWTGDKNCPAIKQDTNTPSSIGATPVRGDNTSITGVTDNSKNRINRQY